MFRAKRSSVIPAAQVAAYRQRAAARDRREDRAAWRDAARRLGPIGIALPIAAFTAVLLWNGGPPGFAATGFADAPGMSAARTGDHEAAGFARCGMVRYTCVIDGDTFWYRGTKIRIADINTPELSKPECAHEAQLAEKATTRLTALLNAGAFSLESIDRENDRYGRTLRIVSRGGGSLGDALIGEGLAERWHGRRGSWCGAAGSAGSGGSGWGS